MTSEVVLAKQGEENAPLKDTITVRELYKILEMLPDDSPVVYVSNDLGEIPITQYFFDSKGGVLELHPPDGYEEAALGLNDDDDEEAGEAIPPVVVSETPPKPEEPKAPKGEPDRVNPVKFLDEDFDEGDWVEEA